MIPTSPRLPLGKALVIGAGGLSCPMLRVLAETCAGEVEIVDDDRVDLSNLHRQTLYAAADVGALKAELAASASEALSGGALRCTARVDRFAPETAAELCAGASLVLDGADNFATKFLAADAAKLAGVPIVQAGVIRFSGWALACAPGHGACLRCVFEDIPRGPAESCALSGVLGPVVGVLGALEALFAVDLLRAPTRHAGRLGRYDAQSGRLRVTRAPRRVDCPLCTGQIRDLDSARYVAPCAA